MSCCRCKSPRVASIGSKSSDLNVVSIGDAEKEGYVPRDMGIGGGDYIEFKWCLDCGQIQREFPLPKCELETGEDEDEIEDDQAYDVYRSTDRVRKAVLKRWAEQDDQMYDPITGRLKK